MQGIWSSQGQKKTRDYCFDMENEKTLRTEELESGQREMQEKIPRATKMVINLTKGKGITDDPESLYLGKATLIHLLCQV